MDQGRLRGAKHHRRFAAETIDLGNEPPLSVDGGTGGLVDRRRLSVQWFSGTILTGLCGAALMGGAVFASLDGETNFASAPELGGLWRYRGRTPNKLTGIGFAAQGWGGAEGYARHDEGKGERVQLEFVSANPTGPLHVGNGWLCSYGDALGRILFRCGWSVSREYYVNDTGGQIRRLGESLLARRRGVEVPEEGYQGEYVSELARAYDGPDDVGAAGRWAAGRILDNIRSTLEGLDIVFDEWFSQASIEESGAVEETVALLRDTDLVYEADGATWLRSTAVGDSRDRRVHLPGR